MKIRSMIRSTLADPVVRWLDRRLKHFESLRSITHSGARWSDVAKIGENVTFYDEATLTHDGAPSDLSIGEYSHVRGEISVLNGGVFELGHHSFVGPGTRIWCRERIVIGSHVLISHLVDIHDSDSHSVNWRQRQAEAVALFEEGRVDFDLGVASAEISIHDDVWIGFKSTILKGVTIGRGAIVAAGSVVTKDVAPFTLVAGNPAKFVRSLEE